MLIQVLPFIPTALQSALEYIGPMDDGAQAAPDVWCHVEATFELQGNVIAADKWHTSWDIVNITNGTIDNTWTQADHQTVHGYLNGAILTYMANAPQAVRYIEQRHYIRSFTPLPTQPIPAGERDKPFNPSGPPAFISSETIAGSVALNPIAPQVATSVTEKTTYPAHWGRNYFPQVASDRFTTSGYLTSQVCTDLANSTSSAYSSLAAAEFFPVVPVTQINKVPARGLLGVTKVQVDNVADVIRRRRKWGATFRALAPP